MFGRAMLGGGMNKPMIPSTFGRTLGMPPQMQMPVQSQGTQMNTGGMGPQNPQNFFQQMMQRKQMQPNMMPQFGGRI